MVFFSVHIWKTNFKKNEVSGKFAIDSDDEKVYKGEKKKKKKRNDGKLLRHDNLAESRG